jgi:predicted transcriptional regulator
MIIKHEPKIEIVIENLMTVQNFAKSIGRTRSTIYNYIRSNRLKQLEIDGVTFVDITTLVIYKPKGRKKS